MKLGQSLVLTIWCFQPKNKTKQKTSMSSPGIKMKILEKSTDIFFRLMKRKEN